VQPKLERWRKALAARPSVRAAVSADYPALLCGFIKRRNSWLSGLQARAGGLRSEKVRSPDGAKRNPGAAIEIPGFRSAPSGLQRIGPIQRTLASRMSR
jgi:hypothetical protein